MLEQLLHDLNSRDARVRQQAIQKARALSSDDLYQLVRMEAISTRRTQSNTGTLAAVIFFVLLCGGGLGSCVTEQPIFVLTFFFALFAVGGILLYRQTPVRARTSLAAVFAEVEDPRFVRILLALLEASRNDDQGTRYLIQALIRQLPGLRADHASALSAAERKTLTSLLETRFGERKLMLVILKALEQIGNADAIPAVQTFVIRLGERLARYRRQDIELQQAAEECLLFLRQKYVQEQQAQTLLRASDAAAHAPEMLLRPATSQPEDLVPEELLRPVSHLKARRHGSKR